jgi:uncharacterized protein Usg
MSPVFLEMVYKMPEHKELVQIIMFKINDEAPDYPKSKIFVDMMKGNIEGEIVTYRVLPKEYVDKQDIEGKFDGNVTVNSDSIH